MSQFARPRDGHPKLFVMIDAYVDESGIHDGAPMCIVAGYFGGKGQIKKLENGWEQVLKRFGFPMEEFHAKDLLKQRRHHPLLKQLAQVIVDHRRVHPVSSGIIVDDFFSFAIEDRKFMTGATLNPVTKKFMKGSTGCPGKPYFVPFQHVLRTATDHAPVGGYAHFAFGCDRPFKEYALALLSQIKEQTAIGHREWSTWKSRDRLGDPSFPEAKKTPSLQAADLFAHLAYLHFKEWIEKGKVVNASELFRMCLANQCCTEDNRFQDKECLADMIEQCHYILDNFSD